jgi:phage baseplate assembly protein W
MELLFVLGYRPALQKRIHEKVKGAISAWKLRCERQSVSTDASFGSGSDKDKSKAD